MEKKYFLLRTKDGAVHAFVGYSIDFALKALGVAIDDILSWSSRTTELPSGQSPVVFLVDGV